MSVPALEPDSGIKRILVVMLRHFGDVLLTSPVFTVLQHACPNAEIDALIYRHTAPMLENHPAISQLHLVEKSQKAPFFTKWKTERALLKAMDAREYDALIVLNKHWRAWRLAWRYRGRLKFCVGPYDPLSILWNLPFRQYFRDYLYGRHRVAFNLDAVRQLGIQPCQRDTRLLLNLSNAADEEADRICEAHQLAIGEFIVIHPTSRGFYKCWPAEKFKTLVNRLVEQGERVVITSGPDSKELQFVMSMLEGDTGSVTNLAGKLSLGALASVIGRAKLFIGVDSAPMHIAAAMGTPVVALFGPSRDWEWGPWRVPSWVMVNPDYRCRPCNRPGCGDAGASDCLKSLQVEPVLEAAVSLMNSTSDKII